MVPAPSDLSEEDHLRQAEGFLDFGAWLVSHRDDAVSVGWAITNAYYASLHVISAYFLARHGLRAASHQERDRWLRDRAFPEFAQQDRVEFFKLKTASEDARYRGQVFTLLHHALYRKHAERLVAKWGDRARKARPSP